MEAVDPGAGKEADEEDREACRDDQQGHLERAGSQHEQRDQRHGRSGHNGAELGHRLAGPQLHEVRVSPQRRRHGFDQARPTPARLGVVFAYRMGVEDRRSRTVATRRPASCRPTWGDWLRRAGAGRVLNLQGPAASVIPLAHPGRSREWLAAALVECARGTKSWYDGRLSSDTARTVALR